MGYGYEILFYFSWFVVLPVLGMLGIAPYAVIHFRNARLTRRDPQVGLKCAVHFVMSVSFLLAITGVSMTVAAYLSSWTASLMDEEVLIGFALAGAGTIFGLCHLWFILKQTNNRQWPMVGRAYTGCCFIISGLVVLTSLAGLLHALLTIDTRPSVEVTTWIGILVVWAISWGTHLWFFMRYADRPDCPGLDGRCGECGYDLRGSGPGEHGKCPECGESIPADVREIIAKSPIAPTAPPAAAAAPAPQQDDARSAD